LKLTAIHSTCRHVTPTRSAETSRNSRFDWYQPYYGMPVHHDGHRNGMESNFTDYKNLGVQSAKSSCEE